jgi:hypothetical protein
MAIPLPGPFYWVPRRRVRRPVWPSLSLVAWTIIAAALLLVVAVLAACAWALMLLVLLLVAIGRGRTARWALHTANHLITTGRVAP